MSVSLVTAMVDAVLCVCVYVCVHVTTCPFPWQQMVDAMLGDESEEFDFALPLGVGE